MKRIEATPTLSFDVNFLGVLILNKKEFRVNFNRSVIIKNKLRCRGKTFSGLWNMQNIVKKNRMIQMHDQYVVCPYLFH
jgi:hypothetical protein